MFVLFPCSVLQLAHCFGFVFRFCVFLSLDSNCLILFWCSVCLVVLLLFILFGSVVSFVCVCFLVSLFVCLISFLPFLWRSVCLLFFFFLQYMFIFLYIYISISTLFFCCLSSFHLPFFFFLKSFLSVCFVSLLHSSVGTLLWFCFLGFVFLLVFF